MGEQAVGAPSNPVPQSLFQTPPLRPALQKVEEVLSPALSLLLCTSCLRQEVGGGFADAGGGGVARQLWKLPFHSHKALPGGGVCSKAAECYPLTSSPTAPVAPIYGQLFQPSPGSNPDTRQRIWSALNLNPPAL